MAERYEVKEEQVRSGPTHSIRQTSLTALSQHAIAFADELAHRPNLGLIAAPKREIERCAELGLLTAPLPMAEGGLGLGVEPGTHYTLLRILAALGGGDLALGRIYEGHVNGLLLVQRYGTREQVARLSSDVRHGMISGVWNTGKPKLLRLLPDADAYRLEGEKTFATGAVFVQRPVVTAELPGHGWQMLVPRMETLGASIDRSFWHPLGMESSESFGIDFTGGKVEKGDLIGAAGDLYLDPIFRGGAVRFAAVQAGAILRLHAAFAEWLQDTQRGDDPYQIARLGELTIAAQEAALWVERAAAVCEESFYRTGNAHTERMVQCANVMRLAIERIGTSAMQKVTAGVGAYGLLQPARFERLIRDLTMYLRQPAPDAALAAIGRSSLDQSRRPAQPVSFKFWTEERVDESIPPKYFDDIYGQNRDPWNFETSAYEKHKYNATLSALPRANYHRGLEVGCSIGVLTSLLADRCEDLLSLDVSDAALATASARCSQLTHVHFACMRVPHQMPEGPFDLIILSEVAYYWSLADLDQAAGHLASLHESGGHLVLVHLTEKVPDYPLTGDEVHDFWLRKPQWKLVHGARHERFRIDVLERC